MVMEKKSYLCKPTLMFKHIAILVPAVAKSFHANAHFRTNIKTSENKAERRKPAYNNV